MSDDYETYTISCGGDTSACIRLPEEKRLVWVTRKEIARNSFFKRPEQVTFLAHREGDIWRSYLTWREIRRDDLWRYADEEAK